MVVFVGLIIPLPYRAKRKLFTFVSESPLVAKVQYAMKVSWLLSMPPNPSAVPSSDGCPLQITFIFILILFLDSVNRVYRVQMELASYSKDGSGAG